MKLNLIFKSFLLYNKYSVISYYFIRKDNKLNNSNVNEKKLNNSNMNEKDLFCLVNLRDKLSNRKLNSDHLFFKAGYIIVLDELKQYSVLPRLIVDYPSYLSLYKFSSSTFMEGQYLEYDLKKIETKRLQSLAEKQEEESFNELSNRVNSLTSFIYTSPNKPVKKDERSFLRNLFLSRGILWSNEKISIKNGWKEIKTALLHRRWKRAAMSREKKRKLIINKLINKGNRGFSYNLSNPYYFLPPHYNRKSMLSQLRHWNTSVYTFFRGDKRMNIHLDLYANKWIQAFFKVKGLLTWIRRREDLEDGIILKNEFNRNNNTMFVNTYLWLDLPAWLPRNIRKLITDEGRSNQLAYHKFMLKQSLASLFGKRLRIGQESFFHKGRQWMLSKPLFKHTSFNVIIDLFIFNNKSSQSYFMLQNLLSRRIMYKYMYSMYANFAEKVKATYSRPRFFYINILDPNVSKHYHEIVRNYEKTIVFKNGIFKFYLFYFLIHMKFSTWRTTLLKKYNISKVDHWFKSNYNYQENSFQKTSINNDNGIINKNAYLLSTKSLFLLQEERDKVLYLLDINNNLIDVPDPYEGEKIRMAAILSWWEDLLEQKRKFEEWALRKDISFRRQTKNYLKGEEYKAWLIKHIEEFEGVNGPKAALPVSNELLEDKSLIYDDIEYEYYRVLPEKLTTYIKHKIRDRYLLKGLKTKKFLSELRAVNISKNLNINMDVYEGKISNVNENEREKVMKAVAKYLRHNLPDWVRVKKMSLTPQWGSSIYNLSMVQDLIFKDFLKKKDGNSIMGSIKDNIFIPGQMKTSLEIKQFPLKIYRDFKKNASSESFMLTWANELEFKEIKDINFSYLVENEINEGQKNNYNFVKSDLNQELNLKDLWGKKDSKFFNTLNLFFKNISKFESKGQNQSFNKVFYSLYDDTKFFRGFGNFWYWCYFSAYVKKEFYIVNRDVLLSKNFQILPRTGNTKSNKFFDGLNNPYNSYVESNYGKTFGRFWPSYINNNKENEEHPSFFYNSALFKPYYRYMIPLFFLKSFTDFCLRVKDYSLAFVDNYFLLDNKEIENTTSAVSHFILVKILLDLFRYNYKSIIRLKPKYYLLNRIRRIKQKYARASLNHWISGNRLMKIGLRSAKDFWNRYDELLDYYYTRIIKDGELDTRRNILVPFVFYFEDLLFTIYGKWVLIRLWPLKRFFLSGYILANRVLMLTLWKYRVRKKTMGFARRIILLMRHFKLKEIKGSYDQYIKFNNTWDTSLFNKFNIDMKKRSLSLSSLENYYVDWNMLDTLNTYPRIINEHANFSPIHYQYSESFKKSLSYFIEIKEKLIRKKTPVLRNLEWSAFNQWTPDYVDFTYYWLRPFNYYLKKLRNQYDISGLRVKLAGKLRHSRSNARSAYKRLFSGFFFGPRHTHELLLKKIPLNVPYTTARIKSYIDYARSDAVTEGGAVSLKVWLYARLSADIQELLLHLIEIKRLYSFLLNKSYNVDPRVNHINYFYQDGELSGNSERLDQWDIKKEIIVKGKIEQVTLAQTGWEKERMKSFWISGKDKRINSFKKQWKKRR